jgi:hypothetical protein
MQRGFAHLLLLLFMLLIVGVVVGALLFWPKNTKPEISQVTNTTVQAQAPNHPVSNPQQYQNDLFSFKYDASKFEVKTDSEDELFKRENGNARKNFTGYIGYQPALVTEALGLVAKDQQIEDAPLAIWVFENPDNLDAQGWFGRYWYYPFNWGMYEYADRAKISPSKEATISGQVVNYGVIAYQQNSPKYYLIPKEGKMILIKVVGDEADKVLQTLSF